MRIEINCWNGNQHLIDTSDGELAARWFAERLPGIVPAAPGLAAEIRMIPEEGERFPRVSRWANEEGLLALAEQMIALAVRLKVRRETGPV